MSVFGAIGSLMQSATDVRTALAVGTRYFRLHNPGVLVECREKKRLLRVQLHDPWITAEWATTRPSTWLSQACSGSCKACAVSTTGARSRYVSRIHSRATAFRSGRSSKPRWYSTQRSPPSCFRSNWLDQPLSTADPLLHLFMQEHIQDVETECGEDLPSQLRRLLPALVAMGRATPREEAGEATGRRAAYIEPAPCRSRLDFSGLADKLRHSMAGTAREHDNAGRSGRDAARLCKHQRPHASFSALDRSDTERMAEVAARKVMTRAVDGRRRADRVVLGS